MSIESTEPLVRIRCTSPEDAGRCTAILEKAGLRPETSLLWLVVRDAHPDRINALLVEGGATARVVAREQIGRLVAYLLDRQGALSDRGQNLENLVGRVLVDAGLSSRWAPLPQASLVTSAIELYRELLAGRAGLVSWERFLGLFCAPSQGQAERANHP
jgi:hypothetical protein